jgi:hypothetical protein
MSEPWLYHRRRHIAGEASAAGHHRRNDTDVKALVVVNVVLFTVIIDVLCSLSLSLILILSIRIRHFPLTVTATIVSGGGGSRERDQEEEARPFGGRAGGMTVAASDVVLECDVTMDDDVSAAGSFGTQ